MSIAREREPIGLVDEAGRRIVKGNMLSSRALEVVSWNPEDHTDIPGFAHGLTRYGGHWFDVGISVVPVDVDPLEALESVFRRLRDIYHCE